MAEAMTIIPIIPLADVVFDPVPGYHIAAIPRGEFGQLSKIFEELHEAQDAEDQGVKLMVLQELSDAIGAMEGYLKKHSPNVTLQDLIDMSKVTQRAFMSGNRK